jgi:glycosyltransferase involved in cell wall biosynthesis
VHLLSIITFILWLLTFIRTIVNLRLVHVLRDSPPLAHEPYVSIIVPARDEARTIERSARAFLAQTYSSFEVIVVNDRSTDATGDVLRAIDDPRLVVIDGEEPPPGWLGKPWALHQGAALARGEMLLFVDADVIYAPGTVRAAVAHAQQSDAAVISLLPKIEMQGFGENVAMPMLAMTLFSFLPTWIANRSRAAALALGGGPGNLVAREAYDAAGGHSELRDAVVDDIGLSRLIRRKLRRRTEAVRAEAFVSIRMYHGLREVVHGFTKNVFFAFGRSFTVGTIVVVLSVLLHILPYGLALAGDPFAIGSVVLITITRIIVFTSQRYPLWNAIFLHPVMVLIWSYIFLRSMWYIGVRRQLLWRGRTYDAREARFGADR